MSLLVEADLILHNGRIWRGSSEGICQALAVWQGKVIATGTNVDVLNLKGSLTKVIDLGGRFACPGLVDNHLHLIATGMAMNDVEVTFSVAPTLATLLEKITARAASTQTGAWVQAFGYDQVNLDTGVHPTREDLDRAAPDHPVLLMRACGHITIANSRALELAGITEDTPVPSGGVIGKTDGKLNGLLADNAQHLLKEALPIATTEELIEAIERGGQHLLSFGITSCMDAAVGHIAGFAEIQAYQMAKIAGRLPVRVWLTLLGDPGNSIVEDSWRAGLLSGAGDDMLRVGGVKVFLDGSAGGRTAWMSQPYEGEPANIGVQMLPNDIADKVIKDYHDRGYQMVCHAIGDQAIEQLITSYEKALAANPDPDRRHRIEHCSFVSASQNKRIKAAGILPAPQIVSIHDFGDSYISVVGEARAHASAPIATWMRMGLKPSTGSDAPVCSPNPFPNLHAMMTRKTARGTIMNVSEALSPEEALQAYTEFGAYSQKEEGQRGRLIQGQWADIAVFNNDLLEASADEILSATRCVLTLLAGRVVHEAL
ncbi:amidohydrolase [Phyllobacterium myrsinacearum]|uniref:Amidohydrolase 3 domain-containing protein n=1 Tax=Phyllobacterium myrsinacearum TaxID=28101 RepID=A0A839EWE3_9HYPH|nr:amidohydrolase [Phyllobacterium myrsinacearum]MBA8881844.1 hypothetical protein [Phyllobacterium myrsinacearum]